MMGKQPDEIEQFAVGTNHYDGCPCPAVAAGYSPGSDNSIEAAERFDQIVGASVGSPADTVDSDTAERAWQQVMDELEADYGPDDLRYHVAEDIAHILDWV